MNTNKTFAALALTLAVSALSALAGCVAETGPSEPGAEDTGVAQAALRCTSDDYDFRDCTGGTPPTNPPPPNTIPPCVQACWNARLACGSSNPAADAKCLDAYNTCVGTCD